MATVPGPVPFTQQIVDTCPGVLGSETSSTATLFLALINFLFAAKCPLAPPVVDNCAPGLKDQDEFDFIIVGGGTTGSVLANRLSENSNFKVLVLEAGGDAKIDNRVPGLWYTSRSTSQDWYFKTEVQNNSCLGFKDQKCYLSCGKVLGGSSTINDLVYFRGNPAEYNTLKYKGLLDWKWSNILKKFKSVENNHIFSNCKKYYSKDGPLNVGKISSSSNIKQVIIDAAAELGFQKINECYNNKFIGNLDFQGIVKKGIRDSSYDAFVVPIASRPNLKIAKNAVVTTVNFNGTTCTGVTVNIDGKNININAKNEVILTAGTINTAKILMLSGIGPWRELNNCNITIKENLPVGANLQDHLSYLGFMVSIQNGTETKNMMDEYYKYFSSQNGYLASIGLWSFAGFINTKTKRAKYPNVMVRHQYFPNGTLKDDCNFLRSFGLNDSIIDAIIEANNKDSLLLFVPTLIYPKSTGSIGLQSADYNDPPKIIPNYLSEEDDVNVLLDTITALKGLIGTKAFQCYTPKLIDLKLPGCSNYVFDTKDYYKCLIKHLSTSGSNLCGTAKMGNNSDSVVDLKFKVRGMDNIRVAGSAVLPNSISASHNARSIMIGEMCSKKIKQEYLPTKF